MTPHERVWLALRTGDYRPSTDVRIAAELEAKNLADWEHSHCRFVARRNIEQVRAAFPEELDTSHDETLVLVLKKAETRATLAGAAFWITAIIAAIGWWL